MRLVQFVALAGICSRRKAVDLIKNNAIDINGSPCNNPAYEVQPNDTICYLNKKLTLPDSYIYLALHKPKNIISASSSPHNEITVIDLVKDAFPTQRLYPVGRLDKDSTGLILLTNDGNFAQKMSHPSFEIQKKYLVKIAHALTTHDQLKLLSGIMLEDGITKFDALTQLSPRVVEVTLHSGKNRIIRRMFAHLGHEVITLHRTTIGAITLGSLKESHYRQLTQTELSGLLS
jgi:23S rRNA pseudouridine2605 synthase